MQKQVPSRIQAEIVTSQKRLTFRNQSTPRSFPRFPRQLTFQSELNSWLQHKLA